MQQKKLWQRYWQQLREEHGETATIAVFFSTRKRNELAPAHIFIEPKIAFKPSAVSIPGQQEIPAVFDLGIQTIWAFLLSTWPTTRHCLLVGVPGSGKTTLLEHTALFLAHERSFHHRRIPDMLPIFLSLHAFTALIESSTDFSLVDAVCEHMQRRCIIVR